MGGDPVLIVAEPAPRRGSAQEIRCLLGRVVARLRQVRFVLLELRDGLPIPGEGKALEAGIPQDLAGELRGTIQSVVGDDLGVAIEQLAEASVLTAADLARRAEERCEAQAAARRLAARIAPRVAELLGAAPSRGRPAVPEAPRAGDGRSGGRERNVVDQ